MSRVVAVTRRTTQNDITSASQESDFSCRSNEGLPLNDGMPRDQENPIERPPPGRPSFGGGGGPSVGSGPLGQYFTVPLPFLNLPESLESAGIHQIPQEWDWNLQEWDRNPQE